jgi:uncharacterized protein YdaU (DUF1376 family)
MPADRPWFKFFPSDFLSSTLKMSGEEKGAYVAVLCLIYDTGNAIDDDPQWIARAAGVSVRRWKQLREILLQKEKIYLTTDGRIANKKAVDLLEIDAKAAEKARENGSKGGLKAAENRRKSEDKELENPENSAKTAEFDVATLALESQHRARDHIPEAIFQSSSTPNPQPPEDEPDKPRASRARACHADPEFAKFWERYPRKTAPDDALKAWRQIIRTGAAPEDIMAGLERYQFNPDPNYVKHPAGWLRGGYWKSEAPTPGLLFAIPGGKSQPSHPDPAEDPWGVAAWCKVQNFEPTTDPRDTPVGKWLWSGKIIDHWATKIAQAARLHPTWRGDWAPMQAWISAGHTLKRIVAAVSRAVERNPTASIHSLSYFDGAIRDYREQAA